MDQNENLPPPRVAWSIITAVALALGAWTYMTSSRVSALEAGSDAMKVQVNDIHTDVRELRDKLLGPKVK